MAALAAATIAATPAAAQVAASPVATARVQITKPLTLAAEQNLDFGNIVVWGTGTASMDLLGNISCTAGNLVCNATGIEARYRVTGSNNQVVTINTASSALTSGANTLTFVPAAPATVTLPNAGATGTTFNVGGSVAIAESTPAGIYQGDITVTVNY